MGGSIDMSLNSITNIADPISAQYIVSKSFLNISNGGIANVWVVFGNQFPALDNTTIAVASLPAGKTISNGKIMVLRMWIQREITPETYFDIECDGFKESWTRFHFYSVDNVLYIYFTGHSGNYTGRKYIIHYVEFA